MQIFSTMYELHQDNLLPDSQWHNCRKDMITVVKSPGGFWVWDSVIKNGLDPEFVAFVDGLRDLPERSYDLRGAGKPADQ